MVHILMVANLRKQNSGRILNTPDGGLALIRWGYLICQSSRPTGSTVLIRPYQSRAGTAPPDLFHVLIAMVNAIISSSDPI